MTKPNTVNVEQKLREAINDALVYGNHNDNCLWELSRGRKECDCWKADLRKVIEEYPAKTEEAP